MIGAPVDYHDFLEWLDSDEGIRRVAAVAEMSNPDLRRDVGDLYESCARKLLAGIMECPDAGHLAESLLTLEMAWAVRMRRERDC